VLFRSTTFNVKYVCPNNLMTYTLVFNGTQHDGTAPADQFGNMPLRMQTSLGGYTNIDELIGYEQSRGFLPIDNVYCRSAAGSVPVVPNIPVHYQSGVGGMYCQGGYESGNYVFLYPFNASSGKITVNISGVWDGSHDVFQCSLVNRDYHLSVRLVKAGISGYNEPIYDAGGDCTGTGFGNSNPINFSRENLTTDANYLIAVYLDYTAGYTGGTCESQQDVFVGEPTVKIDVSMEYANWDCTAWGECFNGLETRTCHDLNGYFADKGETRNCSAAGLAATESAALGFEAGAPVTATTCRPGIGWLGDCVMTNTPDLLYNISVEWPANWSIFPNQDTYTHTPYFAQLTNEWAATGSRSLKMWRIPSANFEPGWSSTLSAMNCLNSSITLNPNARHDFNNETMRAYYDVTFPAEYMTVGFTARACAEIPERTPAMGNFLGSCARTCYGNCTEPNPGNFRFAVIDNETGAITLEKYLTVSDAATPYVWQLPAVDVTRTYRILFSPYSNNPADNNGNCVMFDAVTYNVTAAPIEQIAGGECVPYCDGINFYSVIPGDTCGYSIEYASPKCLSAAAAEKAAVRADFCIGTALYSFNNATGAWQSLADAPGCVEAQAASNITSGTLVMFPSESPLSGFNFLFSPLFIAFVLNLILAIIPTVGVLKYTETEGSDAALLFALIFGAVALMFSFAGLYPAILGIMMVIIAGVIIAALIRQAMAGG